MLGLQGGYIPFVKTKADREKLGDPRPALLERYRDFDDFRTQYRKAADHMVEERTLLSEDVAGLMNLTDRWRPLFELVFPGAGVRFFGIVSGVGCAANSQP